MISQWLLTCLTSDPFKNFKLLLYREYAYQGLKQSKISVRLCSGTTVVYQHFDHKKKKKKNNNLRIGSVHFLPPLTATTILAIHLSPSFLICKTQFTSVTQSCLTLQPHEQQHARPPCPSPTPGVHPNPCPSSWWCHPTISSSVVPFSSCPQSFSTSRSFPMGQLFTSGGQKYWSFSFNISPTNEHPGLISFRMDWLDLLAVLGSLKSLLQHHSSKASIFQRSAFFIVQLSHPYMTAGKTIA